MKTITNEEVAQRRAEADTKRNTAIALLPAFKALALQSSTNAEEVEEAHDALLLLLEGAFECLDQIITDLFSVIYDQRLEIEAAKKK